jgi:ABC-type branched-subunit amino acid transport system substrate-binding protein
MKKSFVLLSVFIFCVVFGYGHALAANPDKIRVGILLPLTGTFAAVAETQKEGALLAVDVVNKKGGLNMPWGKVKVEAIVADDEAKQDVGVRRYRYMVDEGVKGVGGQTWAPLAFAINALVLKEPMAYFPISVLPKEGFMKGKLAPSTFAVLNTPWSIGYMDGAAVIKKLGKKKIFFLARADSWGWDIRDGLYAAAKELGGEIVGYEEVSMGTNDFTTILQKVKAAKPEVFISAQFGGDAIALLKQCYQMGLNKEMMIFNSFITNVVAKGLPPEALEGIYSLSYFYYDLTGFEDKEVAQSAKTFTDLYQAKYNKPPDAYTAIGYVAYMEMFRAFEAAGTFDPMKIAAALLGDKREFNTMKGPAKWRDDHQAVYKYATFLVKGKGPGEQKHPWDLFKVVGYQGGDAIMPTLQSLGY